MYVYVHMRYDMCVAAMSPTTIAMWIAVGVLIIALICFGHLVVVVEVVVVVVVVGSWCERHLGRI